MGSLGGGVSELEETLQFQLRAAGIRGFVREIRWHPTRKWRTDFGFKEAGLLVEVDGGTYSGGRHTRGRGFEEDCRKLAEATLLGWHVIRVTGGMVKSGEALELIQRYFGAER